MPLHRRSSNAARLWRAVSIAAPDAAHRAVIALDRYSSAIAAGCYIHTAATWADTNSDPSSGHYDAGSRLRSAAGRTAIVEVVLLTNGWRTLNIPASAPAGTAAHCNRDDGGQARRAGRDWAGDKRLRAGRAESKRQQDRISQSRCV